MKHSPNSHMGIMGPRNYLQLSYWSPHFSPNLLLIPAILSNCNIGPRNSLQLSYWSPQFSPTLLLVTAVISNSDIGLCNLLPIHIKEPMKDMVSLSKCVPAVIHDVEDADLVHVEDDPGQVADDKDEHN